MYYIDASLQNNFLSYWSIFIKLGMENLFCKKERTKLQRRVWT
jgi:hypothetical protein